MLPLVVWGAATARAERVGDALRNLIRSGGFGGTAESNVLSIRYPPLSYSGRDASGVPHYTRRPFTDSERQLLLNEFGVEQPENLYLSDSTSDAVLLYDPERDCGDKCLVSSYRVGAPSVRRHGESWEAMEKRVMRTALSRFPRTARAPTRSLNALSPDARGAFDTLLTAARVAGFDLRVTESYRSPERQAYLLRRLLTHTGTSLHSDRRAIDVVVGNGRLHDRKNRARWIAFRRWVERFEDGRFRIIGSADSSWDWPHIELPNHGVGFQSVEELLDSAALRAADSSR
ncbi:MAG TPA: hypothetical protein VFK04_13445 [Gemmatimonadaceae bacterium]|jgi:hypothetical protein|nr:hypothetical protein [Gemmatimonadaceae bacterium]